MKALSLLLLLIKALHRNVYIQNPRKGTVSRGSVYISNNNNNNNTKLNYGLYKAKLPCLRSR